ncbi:hypothetical protein GPECTOR_26g562 [Gonium pectorale]|uniref:Ankyrin repeat domain-containing protein n=1 Tax=Gonium pectorale TaxID=33097 RepID=A0A150GFP6_GONPE|nr:hypothetical protein GPECTOR_26g562 [Gonium pectorale]|eukprot:KXZ48659.1 hypothetical protein GPECTOR_26g562 [Gonium pectorale]
MSAAQQPRSARPSRVWSQLLPELAEKIVGCLDSNEVPSFRLVNKAAAAQFRAPRHTTYRLSQPVPPHAFAAHWLAPGATRGLTLKNRRQLLCLTAASGVVANLKVAVQAAGCLPTVEVFEAAATAGQLDSCVWLWEHGCPVEEPEFNEESDLLAAAAGGGHRHVCEWLLGLGLIWVQVGAHEAARGGHVDLTDWLLQQRPQLSVATDLSDGKEGSVSGAAHGCDLPTLQRLWRDSGDPDGWATEGILRAATGSPTPDWAAKVEWLEAQGCPQQGPWWAAACPDAVARLAWLRTRGFPLDPVCAKVAAGKGNAAAVQYLLEEAGVPTNSYEQYHVVDAAARGGHLAALQALHAAGWSFTARDWWLGGHCAHTAASCGHLHVLAWLVEAFGVGALRMGPDLFAEAARSGSVELMAWLQEHGCVWDASTFTGSAESGCVAAVEWLVAQGCPMEEDGAPYVSVCRNGDLAMARLLRRLGVPWGPVRDTAPFVPGSVVIDAAQDAPVPMLRWLLEEGCPVGDYEAARRAAADRAHHRGWEEADELLQAHRHAQQGMARPAAAVATAGGLAV